MAYTLGFAGGGRIARIMLGGWVRNGAAITRVKFAEPDDSAAELLLSRVPGPLERVSRVSELVDCEFIFLAVHPPAIPTVTAELSGKLKPESVVVSLAPKVTISQLQRQLGGFPNVARVIPNAPSLVGMGYNPVCLAKGFPDAQMVRLMSLLQILGKAPFVSESHLELYALLTGMGPTYFWPQFYELRSILTNLGLPPHYFETAMDQMLLGTLAVMEQSSLSESDVLDLIPVKPLAEIEGTLRQAYRDKLLAIYEKIRPVAES